MASKNPADTPGRLEELGQLRARLWAVVDDPDTQQAVRVQALRELRAVSQDMAGLQVPVGQTVQKLEALRLKAVKGGKG